jgi:hypothetical protein
VKTLCRQTRKMERNAQREYEATPINVTEIINARITGSRGIKFPLIMEVMSSIFNMNMVTFPRIPRWSVDPSVLVTNIFRNNLNT